MKKPLVILSLSGLALVVILWSYVQSDHFGERIRPLVAGPLQEMLGPGSRVGWVKANLLPPYLEVRDIVIPSGETGKAVEVRRIRIHINPIPLLWKEVSIPSIRVIEPRFTAVRNPDGRIDLVTLVNSVVAKMNRKKGAGSSPYAVDIRTIVVANGSGQFSDAASRTTVQITKINMTARMRSGGAAVDIRSLAGHVAAEAPAYQRVEADVRASIAFDGKAVSVREASVVSPLLRVNATGSIGVGPDGPLDLKLSFHAGGGKQRRIAAFLKERVLRQQPIMDVSLTVTGRRNSPVVDGKAKFGNVPYGELLLQEAGLRFSYRNRTAILTGDAWKVSRKDRSTRIAGFEVKAGYEKGILLVDSARLTAEELLLTASGTLGMDRGYDLELSGKSWGEGTALSILTGIDIRGDLLASGKLTGTFTKPGFAGSFSGGPFSVRNVPFTSAAGALNYTDAVLSLEDAEITQGRSQYAFDGSVKMSGKAPVFEATLTAERSDVASVVALFYQRIPLDIAATGTLSFRGTASDFSGSARLDLAAGTAYGESFDGGLVVAELSPLRITFPEVVVRKKGGTVKGAGWIGFNGTYYAQVQSAGIDLGDIDRVAPVALAGPLALTVTSSGSFSQPVVKATAAVSPLSYHGYEVGTSQGELTIEGGKLAASLSVRRARSASLDMNGSWKLSEPYAWSISSTAHATDLDASSFAESSDMLAKVHVTFDARCELAGNGAKADTLKGSIDVPHLVVDVADYRVENEGALRARIRDGRVIVQSFVLAGQGTRASLAGSAGIASDLDLTMSGDANLSLLRFATREIEHGDGTASANVRIMDSWKDPNITGEVTVRNGLVKIREVPQRFSNLTGTISFDRNRIVTEGLRGDFGGGTITVNGFVQMKNLKLVDFTSKTLMENVTFRYPQGLTATLGGTMYYDGDSTSQTLSGELAIRRARYDRRVDFKTMLVDLSRGFKAKTKEDLGLLGETKLDVRVYGKDDIILENNVAKIPFELDMLFRGTVNRVQVLGHMETRKGEVYFRKNIFRILHGSADFADLNRINPVLDVEAETRVREYQIRLSVTGSADRSTVTFVSEPPLTDSNILALLTLGRKTEDIRGKESGIGGGEAIGIATGPVQDILESRARSLTGLDRFQVDPYFSKSDVAVPRVTAGKELVKDKLYVTYSSNVGAANPEQTFSIEYLMNQNVSLVGERNDIGNIGADIKFRFGFR